MGAKRVAMVIAVAALASASMLYHVLTFRVRDFEHNDVNAILAKMNALNPSAARAARAKVRVEDTAAAVMAPSPRPTAPPRRRYRGVAKLLRKGGTTYWTARMRRRDGKIVRSGRFDSAEAAAREHDRQARREFGAAVDASTLNFPDEGEQQQARASTLASPTTPAPTTPAPTKRPTRPTRPPTDAPTTGEPTATARPTLSGLQARGNYIGVAKLVSQKEGAQWVARLRRPDGSTRLSGRFNTPRGAAVEYDQMARRWFGDAATLNFPRDAKEKEEEDAPTHEPTTEVAVGGKKYIGVAKLAQAVPSGGTRWVARLRKPDGSFRFSAQFETPREAAIEHDRLALLHHGDLATLNFPKGVPTFPKDAPTQEPTTEVDGNALTIVGVGGGEEKQGHEAAAAAGGASRSAREPTPAPPAPVAVADDTKEADREDGGGDKAIAAPADEKDGEKAAIAAPTAASGGLVDAAIARKIDKMREYKENVAVYTNGTPSPTQTKPTATPTSALYWFEDARLSDQERMKKMVARMRAAAANATTANATNATAASLLGEDYLNTTLYRMPFSLPGAVPRLGPHIAKFFSGPLAISMQQRIEAVQTFPKHDASRPGAVLDVKVVVGVAAPQNAVAPETVSQTLEPIAHSIYPGGLYSQMLFGESFEEPQAAVLQPVEILRNTFFQIERALHWHTATALEPHAC